MDIGIIYSSRDPKQLKAREFVRNFINQRGILANYRESDQPVKSPKLIINGQALFDQRQKPRKQGSSMFPDIKSIAKLLEYHTWCL